MEKIEKHFLGRSRGISVPLKKVPEFVLEK
jgi:hypothetical protein